MTMSDPIRDQKGAVIVIAAVLLGVSLLLLAMVVDLGTVWLVKARVQTALDAATLAATSEARVQVHKSFVPNLKTERFMHKSEFPDPRLIVGEPQARYREKTVAWEVTYETAEGNIETGIFGDPAECPYPSVGRPTPLTEEVFEGYDVTYVESYSEEIESLALWLDESQASDRASEVMDLNSQAERQSGVVIKPIASERTAATGDSMGYFMEVQVEVPSKLLAPIMGLLNGPQGSRLFRFRVSSESKAFLNLGGD